MRGQAGNSFCMAVGAYKSGARYRGLAEVLNGGVWAIKPVPSPTVNRNIFINEVSCDPGGRCVLVGQHYGKTIGSNLAETWNGRAWKIITADGPAGTSQSQLQDVSCPIVRFCAVVGYAYAGSRYHATAYTWANGTWQQIEVAGPRGARDTELAGLACTDATDCMAVGNYVSAAGKSLPYAARWHQGSWSVLSVPAVPGVSNSVMQGVSCLPATMCVAAGTAGPARRPPHAFAEIYRAGKWHLGATGAAGTALIGASCSATNLCLLSGFAPGRGLAWKWNGSTFTNLNPYQPGGTLHYYFFQHASCGSFGCMAVGGRYNSRTEHTLAEVWTGTWGLESPLNP